MSISFGSLASRPGPELEGKRFVEFSRTSAYRAKNGKVIEGDDAALHVVERLNSSLAADGTRLNTNRASKVAMTLRKSTYMADVAKPLTAEEEAQRVRDLLRYTNGLEVIPGTVTPDNAREVAALFTDAFHEDEELKKKKVILSEKIPFRVRVCSEYEVMVAAGDADALIVKRYLMLLLSPASPPYRTLEPGHDADIRAKLAPLYAFETVAEGAVQVNYATLLLKESPKTEAEVRCDGYVTENAAELGAFMLSATTKLNTDSNRTITVPMQVLKIFGAKLKPEKGGLAVQTKLLGSTMDEFMAKMQSLKTKADDADPDDPLEDVTPAGADDDDSPSPQPAFSLKKRPETREKSPAAQHPFLSGLAILRKTHPTGGAPSGTEPTAPQTEDGEPLHPKYDEEQKQIAGDPMKIAKTIEDATRKGLFHTPEDGIWKKRKVQLPGAFVRHDTGPPKLAGDPESVLGQYLKSVLDQAEKEDPKEPTVKLLLENIDQYTPRTAEAFSEQGWMLKLSEQPVECMQLYQKKKEQKGDKLQLSDEYVFTGPLIEASTFAVLTGQSRTHAYLCIIRQVEQMVMTGEFHTDAWNSKSPVEKTSFPMFSLSGAPFSLTVSDVWERLTRFSAKKTTAFLIGATYERCVTESTHNHERRILERAMLEETRTSAVPSETEDDKYFRYARTAFDESLKDAEVAGDFGNWELMKDLAQSFLTAIKTGTDTEINAVHRQESRIKYAGAYRVVQNGLRYAKLLKLYFERETLEHPARLLLPYERMPGMVKQACPTEAAALTYLAQQNRFVTRHLKRAIEVKRLFEEVSRTYQPLTLAPRTEPATISEAMLKLRESGGGASTQQTDHESQRLIAYKYALEKLLDALNDF